MSDQSFDRDKRARDNARTNGASALEVALTGISVGFDERAEVEDMLDILDCYAARVAHLLSELAAANKIIAEQNRTIADLWCRLREKNRERNVLCGS